MKRKIGYVRGLSEDVDAKGCFPAARAVEARSAAITLVTLVNDFEKFMGRLTLTCLRRQTTQASGTRIIVPLVPFGVLPVGFLGDLPPPPPVCLNVLLVLPFLSIYRDRIGFLDANESGTSCWRWIWCCWRLLRLMC